MLCCELNLRGLTAMATETLMFERYTKILTDTYIGNQTDNRILRLSFYVIRDGFLHILLC